MPKLANAARPAGQSEEYRFVKNEDSGRTFKAKHEIRTSPGGRPEIVVTISPVDETGKALPNEAGAPDIKSHTHEFTEVELSAPDFDLEARIATILDTSITEKERDLTNRELVKGIGSRWTGNKPLALAKRA